MRLNIKNIINFIKDIRNYVFPLKKITNKFKNISSKEDLKNVILSFHNFVNQRLGTGQWNEEQLNEKEEERRKKLDINLKDPSKIN